MAKTVQINVVGDASGFNKTLAGAEKTSTKTATTIGSSFKGAMATINVASQGAFGPMQDVISGLGPAMDALSKSGKKVGASMVGVGAGIAGAGVALQGFGSVDQAAEKSMDTAFKNVGANVDDFKGKIDDTVGSMAKYGYSSAQTYNSLQSLTTATKSPTKALADIGTVANLAATMHISLASATSKYIALINGKGLKTQQALGISYTKVTTTAKTVTSAQTALTKAHAAQAAANANLEKTTTGVANAEAAGSAKSASAATAALATLNSAQLGASSAAAKVTAAQAKQVAAAAAAAAAQAKYQTALDAVNNSSTDTAAKQASLKAALATAATGVSSSAAAVTSAAAGVTVAQNNQTNAAAKVVSAQSKLTAAQNGGSGSATQAATAQAKLTAAHAKVAASAAVVKGAQDKLTKTQDSLKQAAQQQGTMLTQVSKVTSGQASAAANTFAGRMKGLRTEVENNVAALGVKYGPALTAVGGGVAVLGAGVDGASTIIKKFSGAQNDAKKAMDGVKGAQDALAVSDGVTGLATDAEAAATGLEDVALSAEDVDLGVADVEEGIALAPILLIIAAIALLGLGVYELYTNWSTVWADIKAIALDAWQYIDGYFVQPVEGFFQDISGFISQHWELILAILTGPIGLAVLFISNNVDGIVAFFTGLPARIGTAITGIWDGLKNSFGGAVTVVENKVDDVVNYFAGMPNKIYNGLTGMWDFISAEFKNMVDDVAYFWNNTAGQLSFHIPSWVPGIGGDGFDVPQIPHFAQGGIVTQPTVALIGEAGPEMVIPLSAMGKGANGGTTANPGGGDIYITTPLVIDGRTFAQQTVRYTRDALIKNNKNTGGKASIN